MTGSAHLMIPIEYLLTPLWVQTKTLYHPCMKPLNRKKHKIVGWHSMNQIYFLKIEHYSYPMLTLCSKASHDKFFMLFSYLHHPHKKTNSCLANTNQFN